MNFTVIEGIISGLDRTNHLSGGGETNASTSHISIFNLSGERVMLTTNSPAMIADGDNLKLVGVRNPGQFSAVVCKNLTTGWVTPLKTQGCAKAMLIVFIIFGILATLLFPLFIIMPIFAGVFLFLVIRTDSQMKSAYNMLNQ